jgi:predicted Fe-S protein YdhL (DUF1289 family)
MKRICRASGVRYPRERATLVKKAIKGRQKNAKERVKKEKLRRDAEPAGTKAQETIRQPTCLEDLQRSIQIEKDQRRRRKEIAEEEAKEIMLLALDPDKEISGPVLDALEKVLPRILKRRYGITLSFWAMQKLNEITSGDLSYETVTKMVQYAKLSDDEKQAIHDLLRKLDGITLVEIAQHARLSDEDKQAVQALLFYSQEKKMSPMEAIVFLDLRKRLEEGGVRAWLGEPDDEKKNQSQTQ